GVGHRVPTGFVDRNLVLVVEGFREGQSLPVQEGPALPASAGKEFAGMAGGGFGTQHTDFDGGVPPPRSGGRAEATNTRRSPAGAERRQRHAALAGSCRTLRFRFRSGSHSGPRAAAVSPILA